MVRLRDVKLMKRYKLFLVQSMYQEQLCTIVHTCKSMCSLKIDRSPSSSQGTTSSQGGVESQADEGLDTGHPGHTSGTRARSAVFPPPAAFQTFPARPLLGSTRLWYLVARPRTGLLKHFLPPHLGFYGLCQKNGRGSPCAVRVIWVTQLTFGGGLGSTKTCFSYWTDFCAFCAFGSDKCHFYNIHSLQ